MASQPYNLIDGHFQHSNFFRHLPVFDEIYYEGLAQPKVQAYRAVREGQACRLFGVTIVRQGEDILWGSTRDLIERSVRDVAGAVQGIYHFDLLSFDIHAETRAFRPDELSRLILSHSLKTRPGYQRLIKYSSVYGLLQKIVDEPWGKIVFKAAVEVFRDKPSFLCSLVKRLLPDAGFSREPVIVLIHDMSLTPLWDPDNELQQKSLRRYLDGLARDSVDFLPEIYVQDKNGARELMSGTRVDQAPAAPPGKQDSCFP